MKCPLVPALALLFIMPGTPGIAEEEQPKIRDFPVATLEALGQ